MIRGKDLETRPLPEEMLELPRMISLPGRWVEAGHVQIGDQLLLVNGKEVSVEEVETVPYAEKVFNLEIAEIHTYAVGKTGVLVHNSDDCGKGSPGDGIGKAASNKTSSKKISTPKIKGVGKVADLVPTHVPKNWSEADISDAISTYENSIKLRKAEAAAFDAAGGGHIWTRKAHYERIVQEEDFLRQLKNRLEDL